MYSKLGSYSIPENVNTDLVSIGGRYTKCIILIQSVRHNPPSLLSSLSIIWLRRPTDDGPLNFLPSLTRGVERGKEVEWK